MGIRKDFKVTGVNIYVGHDLQNDYFMYFVSNRRNFLKLLFMSLSKQAVNYFSAMLSPHNTQKLIPYSLNKIPFCKKNSVSFFGNTHGQNIKIYSTFYFRTFQKLFPASSGSEF